MATMQDLEVLTQDIVKRHAALYDLSTDAAQAELDKLSRMEDDERELISDVFDECSKAHENGVTLAAHRVPNDWIDDHFTVEGTLIYADSEDRHYGWKNGSKLRVLELHRNHNEAHSTCYCQCMDDAGDDIASWMMLGSINITKVEAKV